MILLKELLKFVKECHVSRREFEAICKILSGFSHSNKIDVNNSRKSLKEVMKKLDK